MTIIEAILAIMIVYGQMQIVYAINHLSAASERHTESIMILAELMGKEKK